MVVNLRIGWEYLRASLSQIVDWLLGFDVDEKQPVCDGSEVARYLADIEGRRQKLAAKYEESGIIGSATVSAATPHTPRGTRTINYWSNSGHFWRWQYNENTIQKTFNHIMDLAEDPTVPFTFDDSINAHELLRLMELTMDCQDVVGF